MSMSNFLSSLVTSILSPLHNSDTATFPMSLFVHTYLQHNQTTLGYVASPAFRPRLSFTRINPNREQPLHLERQNYNVLFFHPQQPSNSELLLYHLTPQLESEIESSWFFQNRRERKSRLPNVRHPGAVPPVERHRHHIIF